MIFDRFYYGPQGVTEADQRYAGSRFADLRAAIFANSYYLTWGTPGDPGLPTYEVTLGRTLRGLVRRGEPWHFLRASRRAIASRADLRWGPDGRGFRRLLHPNGVCLTGTWEIDDGEATGYTGYFRAGSRALIIGRYSTCCTETRAGRYRSLSVVGKLYPTTDADHPNPLPTANFITQEDLGGAKHVHINDAVTTNAPDVTPWRRGRALPVLLLTGLVFRFADRQTTVRQLYPIAELGEPPNQPTRAPMFMRLRIDQAHDRLGTPGLDFRDEVLSHIYDRGVRGPRRSLTFSIEVSDEGTAHGLFVRRWNIRGWKRIGRIVCHEAVASYNGDFVVHFHHPPWRDAANDGLATSPRASERPPSAGGPAMTAHTMTNQVDQASAPAARTAE